MTTHDNKKVLFFLLLLLPVIASAYDGAVWHFSNSGNNVTLIPITDTNPKDVCLQDGTNCPTSNGSNNFATNVTVTNGSTHTITIGRSGLSAISATFDDQTGNGTGGSGTIQGVTALDTWVIVNNGTVVNLTINSTLFNNTYALQANVTAIVAGLGNSTLARTGTCNGENTTHILVTQNTTTSGVSCVFVAKNPGTSSGGGSGMTSFNINLSNNTATTVQNNSQLYFLNTSGILLSLSSANITWGIDMSYVGKFFTNGSASSGGIQTVQAKDIWAIVDNGTISNVTINTTLLNNTFVMQANLSAYMLNFMNVWRLGSTTITNNTLVSAGDGIVFDGLGIAISNTTIFGRASNQLNNRSGWLNSSALVSLAINTTNLSIGTVALFVNTNNNFTGINTSTPGSALDVRGTLNASVILQGGKSVCLGDGTNCPGTSNSTGYTQWLLGSTAVTNNTAVKNSYGIVFDTLGIGIDNTTLDTRWVKVGSLAFLNTSTTVYLANNNTNVSLNYGSFFINTAQNRTGIGIPNPGTALDVSGTANITKLQINSSTAITYNGSCINITGGTSQWLVC